MKFPSYFGMEYVRPWHMGKKLLAKCRFWSYKVWELEEVSREMLVLLLPPVSSRVSGFPVASPCLWGKLQNLSFCHVANCENCRRPRTKCCFFCIHVSCLESLVFLWRRRVYGGSWKTSPIRMCPSRLSCRFAWQAWHFVTFQLTCLIACQAAGELHPISHDKYPMIYPFLQGITNGAVPVVGGEEINIVKGDQICVQYRPCCM